MSLDPTAYNASLKPLRYNEPGDIVVKRRLPQSDTFEELVLRPTPGGLPGFDANGNLTSLTPAAARAATESAKDDLSNPEAQATLGQLMGALAVLSGRISTYDNFGDWTPFALGGASSLSDAARLKNRNLDLDTTSTSGRGYAVLETSGIVTGQGRSRNVSRGSLNWSAPVQIAATVSRASHTANGKNWWYIGAATNVSPTAADPANKAIGFRVDGNALKGIAHDGTTLYSVDLAITIADVFPRDILATSDGQGLVEFYVNDSKVGEITTGPTGESTSLFTAALIAITNGADSASQRWSTHHVGIYSK